MYLLRRHGLHKTKTHHHPKFQTYCSLKNLIGCRGRVPGTEEDIKPTQFVMACFKITLCPGPQKPSHQNVNNGPRSHATTAIKNIKNATTGYPNNKAIMASIVPKKALSDSITYHHSSTNAL
jgi:hypothetical protein